jgi:hypothetical protein
MPVVWLRPDGGVLTLVEQCAHIMLPLKFIEAATFRIAELQRHRNERASALTSMRTSVSPVVPLRVMVSCLLHTSRKLAGGSQARVGTTTRLLEDCIIDRVMRGHCKRIQVRQRARFFSSRDTLPSCCRPHAACSYADMWSSKHWTIFGSAAPPKPAMPSNARVTSCS